MNPGEKHTKKARAKMRTSAVRRRSVTCGHRLCLGTKHKGPRWLSIVYFQSSKWSEDGDMIRLQSRCATCITLEQRDRRGHRPRRECDPWLGKTHTEEYVMHRRKRAKERHEARMQDPEYARNFRKRRREIYSVSERKKKDKLKERMQDPKYAHEYRERRRMGRQAKREMNKQTVRPVRKRVVKPPLSKLPWAPLEEAVNGRRISDVARTAGVNERAITRAKRDGYIDLTHADAICIGLGTHLLLVYPHLYD